mgnify:CR=1 FL=1
MDKIKGYIDHLIFRNSDNGYTVMVVNHEGEELTCVGTFPVITEGELIEATGHYTEHAVYGTQFQIQKLEIKDPEDTAAIERYLGSGVIKGIGIALAARIVRKFKEDTFRIMEEEPERLAEVKGISEKKAREIWFLCRKYNAQEALDMGLVNKVVPLDKLEDEYVQWAEEMMLLSPLALRMIKAGLNAELDGQAGIQELAGDATMLYYMTDEAQEGGKAFLEKRRPRFEDYPKFP